MKHRKRALLKVGLLVGVLSLLPISAAGDECSSSHVTFLHVPETVTIPRNLTENMDISVSLTDDLPSPCFRPGEKRARFSGNRILLETDVIYFDKCLCPQVMTPYKEATLLGKLSSGKYGVYFLNEEEEEIYKGSFRVTQ